MKIGLSLSSATDFAGMIEEIRQLEQSGLDVVWLGESYGYDAVSALGALAVSTVRVEIGSSILPIYSRTPALIAMTAAGLDRLSGGRFILGLGSSGPQVIEVWHGVPFDSPVARAREIVEICRSAWRRERIEHRGRTYDVPLPPDRGEGLGKPLKFINPPVRERIPVYVAALGPANVALTAEIADGWAPVYFWPERKDEMWGEALRRGLARRSPELSTLEIAVSAGVAVGAEDGPAAEAALDGPRRHVAQYVGGMGAPGRNFDHAVLTKYGFGADADEIQRRYLSGDRAGAVAAVPREFLERISLVGSAAAVKDRLAAFRDAGVTVLNVRLTGDNLTERRRQLEQIKSLAG